MEESGEVFYTRYRGRFREITGDAFNSLLTVSKEKKWDGHIVPQKNIIVLLTGESAGLAREITGVVSKQQENGQWIKSTLGSTAKEEPQRDAVHIGR